MEYKGSKLTRDFLGTSWKKHRLHVIMKPVKLDHNQGIFPHVLTEIEVLANL